MGRTRIIRSRRAIDLVEAGYSLEGTDAEWLARILDVASTDLALGKGCYAFTCRIVAAKFEMGPLYVERDLDPGFGAVVEQVNREVPDAATGIMIRSAAICGGLAEVLGEGHPSAIQIRAAGRSRGIVDAFSLYAQDGDGRGIDLSAPADAPVHTHPRVRGIWRRVGLHLAAGMRLRRRLAEARGEVDAIASPDGAIHHAEGTLRRDGSLRSALARRVRAMDKARTSTERRDPAHALELWKGLVLGEWSLVDRWESDGRRYIVAHRNRPDVRDPRALTRHESAVLGYAALGASNKEIAFALGLPTASIASAISELFRKLGCRRRTDLHVFADPSRALRFAVPLDDDRDLDVLASTAPRHDDLEARLTVTEREVAACIIRGDSSAEIARSRSTSVHTVANQVRRILEKLGVHSRAEMVRALTE